MNMGKVGLSVICYLSSVLCSGLFAQSQTVVETPEALCKQANAKYTGGDYKGALADSDKALKLNPNLADACVVSGKAKFALSDYKDALADLQKATGLNPALAGQLQQLIADAKEFMSPKDAMAYAKRAAARYGFRDYEGAIDDCSKAIAQNPGYSYAYNLRASAKMATCNYSGAISDWEHVIKLDPKSKNQLQKNIDEAKLLISPKDADTFIKRARSRYSMGKYKEALEDCNSAIRINPSHSLAYNLRGYVKWALADYKGVVEDWEKAIQLNPPYKNDLEKGLDAVREFLNGPDADTYIRLANFRFSVGDYKGALADFEKAKELAPSKGQQINKLISDVRELMNPSDPQAYTKRGDTKYARADYKGAVEDYDSAIKIAQTYAEAYVGRGNSNYGLGQYDAAIKDWQKAIELKETYKLTLQSWIDNAKMFSNPKEASDFLKRANTKFSMKDYVGVLEDCDKALELNGKIEQPYVLRANVKSIFGDNAGAIADLDSAIKIDPKDVQAYIARGSAKVAICDYNGAVEDWKKACELEPSRKAQLDKLIDGAKGFATPKDAVAYLKRANSKFATRDYKGAMSDCDSALQVNPKSFEAIIFRGNCKNALGDHKGAIEDFDAAIKMAPKDTMAYAGRGDAKYALGDFSGAIDDWQKVIEIDPSKKVVVGQVIDNARALIDPKDADSFRKRGDRKFANGDYKGALDDYENALKLDQSNAPAYAGRGDAKNALEDYDGAIKDWEKAIELDHSKEIFLKELITTAKARLSLKSESLPIKRGDAKFSLGDYNGAKEEFESAVKANPSDATTYNKRGNANFALGKYDDAIADWGKAEELDPTRKPRLDPWIAEAKSRINTSK